MAREIITFQCTECKNRNYSNTKNKKTTTERLEFKKFCPYCRKHRRTSGDQVNWIAGERRKRLAPLDRGVG